MACFGSKSIGRKEIKQNDLVDRGLEDSPPKKRGRNGEGQKPRKGGSNLEKHEKKSKNSKKGKAHGNDRFPKSSTKITHGSPENQNLMVPRKASKPVSNILRKNVDPETARYFAEIANLFESNAIDLEDRSTICANALEETRGKELELATDGVISRTLQTLVEGCDLEQLCVFLLNCVKSFPIIAMDKFGSHVAEAALRSLATHLEDENSREIIEDILNKICKVIAADAANVMCSCYGSHVLRTLLCLCKGVPLDYLQDFHTTKRSAVLAERLGSGLDRSVGSNPKSFEHGFTDMFKHFVREMLKSSKVVISTLRAEKNSSLVLQTVLKLSIGYDEELRYIISILLGFDEISTPQEKTYAEQKQEIMVLLEGTASSHLLEVIVEVAPEELRNDMLTETFKGSLFEISSHHCGNFVVQALISSAKTTDQIRQVWEELGSKIKELLELGKTGVVASILAACQRLETNRLECSQALAAAASSDSESSGFILAHILFLESFLKEKSSWEWPLDGKMSVLGCLMLQSIFGYPHKYVRIYVASLLSMEDDQILQISKDPGGSRVLEAFLSSSVTAKRKFKVLARLQGHYGEIAMIPSGSFLVEKCFTASNFSHKEAIVAELAAVQSELLRTKHGIHLLKKLDVEGYARRPEQWRSRQTSKETTHTAFQVELGLNVKAPGSTDERQSAHNASKKRKQKEKTTDGAVHGQRADKPDILQKDLKRQKSDTVTSSKESNSKKPIAGSTSTPFVRNSGKRKSPGFISGKPSLERGKPHKPTTDESNGSKFIRDGASRPFVRNPGKSELADLACKKILTAGEVRRLFKPETTNKI